MAYLHARAGLARAGVTLAGLSTRFLTMTIGGVSASPDASSIAITESLDAGANRCAFVLRGVSTVPVPWSEVVLGYRHAARARFGGHVLRVTRRLRGFESGIADLEYQIECVDYTWLLDLRSRVTRRYYSQPVNGIVADLLRTYTEGGFRVGYVPDTLGSLEIEFTGVKVSEALTRIAKAVGAYYWLDYRKQINIATSVPTGNVLTIGNNTTDIWDLVFDLDGSQVRTVVDFLGGGSEVAAPYVAGGSTLAVAQCAWYSPAGGRMRVRFTDGTYAGVSATSGPGELTGVSLGVDAAIGDPVAALERREDAGAQATLAAALGGGHSGIAAHEMTDGRVGATLAGDRAASELDFFKTSIEGARWGTSSDQVRPGVAVPVALTSQPETINASVLVQQTQTRIEGPAEVGVVQWATEVEARRWRRDLVGILEQVGG